MMNNSREWSLFRVLVKVEQVDDNFFLNTCDNSKNFKIA